MRNAFANYLNKIAETDKNLFLLVGDIGFRIFDDFRKNHEDKFLNCGIAEQNMISVAAGMASEGKRPIVYTIIPFLVMRAYEQIRVDIGINNEAVLLVGVGGGLAYDKLGSTHHAYEDICLMRCIPNMKIFTPFDPKSTILCTNYGHKNLKKGFSSYIRLSKGGEPNLDVKENIGEFICLLHGQLKAKNIIITHGAITYQILNIVNDSSKDICLLTILSFDDDVINKLLLLIKNSSNNTNLLVIEENFRIGGLFETLSIEMTNKNIYRKISFLNLPNKYIFDIYDRETLLNKYGITKNNIENFLK